MFKILKQEFTAELKEVAVKWVRGGQGIALVSRSLGLVEQTLRNWVKAAKSGKLNPAGTTTITPEPMELSHMQAENAWLAHTAHGRQHPAGPRQDMVHGAGRPQRARTGLHRDSDRQVAVISGDGAFGINAMEIDCAERQGAKVVFIIANTAAWNDYAAMARVFDLLVLTLDALSSHAGKGVGWVPDYQALTARDDAGKARWQ